MATKFSAPSLVTSVLALRTAQRPRVYPSAVPNTSGPRHDRKPYQCLLSRTSSTTASPCLRDFMDHDVRRTSAAGPAATNGASVTNHADLATLLFSEPSELTQVPSFAWGFGGLHGGIALSLAAARMAASVPDHSLRSVVGQFHRPIRETFALESHVIRSGRSAGAAQATATDTQGVCLTATAVLGSNQAGSVPAWAPAARGVPLPNSLASVQGLEKHSAVLGQVDLRPVGSIDVHVGSSERTMTAWVRILGSDEPVSPSAVIFFLDVLPPSYARVLTRASARPVPTVELAAHLAPHRAASPWVLVRSHTVSAEASGWVTEMVHAWDIDGVHLGSAQQLRLAVSHPEPGRA
ncbi:thioesterase family protein [Nocardioides sp. NPDC051685]|uniref:thioesterase family protein n=1 Tax=Nocardioides sp. NPDC051685 TaxID=3364334 RepID=UPI0037B15AAA